jgi:2-dehydro-3-deoxyphosphogluconate aldolase/(4S)-4-hydroxy-2-oxoglutarate aldolase
MSGRQQVIHVLEATGVIAVIRAERAAGLVAAARSLAAGGVRLVEITMTVPRALEVIQEAVDELGDEALIGAGTVLDATTARLAILAGASFVVGPSLDEDVIVAAHLHDRAAMPGCLTPTEVVKAWKAGADVVKMFPGRVATPGYFRDLCGPLPHVRLLPTGNVDMTTAPEYIAAGAIGVGIGRALVPTSAIEEGRFDDITSNARELIRVVAEARQARRG